MITIICDDKNFIYQLISDKLYRRLELSGDAYAELDFVSTDDIKEVNSEKRGIDKITDVLSFPFLDKLQEFCKENYPYDYNEEISAVSLGNIIVCDEVAKMQAEEYGHSTEREMAYLFLHGLLHLLGYDHESDDDKEEMRSVEEEILNSINITR